MISIRQCQADAHAETNSAKLWLSAPFCSLDQAKHSKHIHTHTHHTHQLHNDCSGLQRSNSQTGLAVWLTRMSYVAILGLARRHEVWCRLHLATCNGLSQDLKVRLKSWDHLVRLFKKNQNTTGAWKAFHILLNDAEWNWCGINAGERGETCAMMKYFSENTLYTLVRMIPFLADELITPECVRHDSWVCSDVVGVVSRYKGYLGLFTELPAKAGMGSTLIHCWQLPNGQGCHVATGRFLADLLTTS